MVGIAIAEDAGRDAGRAAYRAMILLTALFGSFVSDLLFIAITRRLLRAVQPIKNYLVIVLIVVANLLCAVVLVIFPLTWGRFEVRSNKHAPLGALLVFTSLMNYLDAFLALLFVLLSIILLVHRVLWPLLSRTLFRLQDIGAKGRRAILMSVGLSLLGTSIFGGEFPKLWEKILEHFGG
jgi:hypothetical protein